MTDGVPAAVDSAFPALFAWLGEHGVSPAGPPFIRVNAIDEAGEPLELECPPVPATRAGGASPRRAAGRAHVTVRTSARTAARRPRPGSRARGPHGWIAEHGRHRRRSERGTELACSLDVLHVGPDRERDPSRWRTELALLIVG